MNRSDLTTVRILRTDLIKLNQCCKKRAIGHIEFFSELFNSIYNKKWQKFYDSLPLPSNYVKPLQNTKIDKKYITTRCV